MEREARKEPAASRPARGTFDRPLDGPIDDLAGHAVDRTHSQVWAPALVAVLGLLGMSIALIVVGEAITHLGLLGWLRNADEQVNANLAAHRTSSWNSFSDFWSHSAETLPIVVGALLVELVLVVRKRWRDLPLVVIGLAVELATFLIVNELVRRPRPDVERLGIVP